MPVHLEPRRVAVGRGGRDHAADPATDHRDYQHADRCPDGMEAAIRLAQHEHAAEQCPAENCDISAGFDQPGRAEHFVVAHMLRQDGIFDRPEKCRVDAHREQGGEQQPDDVEIEANRTDHHDQYFGGFHDSDDLRLVQRIGKLAGECGQQEKRQDEQAAGDGAERRFLLGVAIDAVDYQHDHRRAEQIVIERAEELGRKDRQEATGTQQMPDILHSPKTRQPKP